MYYAYPNTVANYNQNRLNQLQQQYNNHQQLADNNFRNNQMPLQQQQQQQIQSPQTQQNLLKGRAVTGIEEARSAIIDFDGSINVFLDLANGKIYTKQINLDGTASLNTYKLDDTPVLEYKPAEIPIDYVNKTEFESLKTEVKQYKSILEKLLGGNENVQPENNDADDDAR